MNYLEYLKEQLFEHNVYEVVTINDAKVACELYKQEVLDDILKYIQDNSVEHIYKVKEYIEKL